MRIYKISIDMGKSIVQWQWSLIFCVGSELGIWWHCIGGIFDDTGLVAYFYCWHIWSNDWLFVFLFERCHASAPKSLPRSDKRHLNLLWQPLSPHTSLGRLFASFGIMNGKMIENFPPPTTLIYYIYYDNEHGAATYYPHAGTPWSKETKIGPKICTKNRQKIPTQWHVCQTRESTPR